MNNKIFKYQKYYILHKYYILKTISQLEKFCFGLIVVENNHINLTDFKNPAIFFNFCTFFNFFGGKVLPFVKVWNE